MKILISIFLCVILIFITSKMKMNIKYLLKNPRSFKIKFNINIGLYLFGIIKIFGVSLKDDGIHILIFKFPYPKIKLNKISVKKLPMKEIFEKLDVKIEEFNLEASIGAENTMLTVFSIFAISTLLSIFSAKNRKNINMKKYYYKLIPVYNSNFLKFETSSKISLKIRNIVKVLLLKNKKSHNEKNYKINIKTTSLKI